MFILSANKQLEPELLAFNRLYAYPSIPILDNEKIIILDSGAFALSLSKKKMDAAYIAKLAEHYKKYGGQKSIFCIAPDVFKSPSLSIKQFKEFINNYPDVTITPVLQFQSSSIDLFNTKKQIDEYSRISKSKMICISNNKFNPVKQFKELNFMVENIRQKLGNIHIHVLGAGYSHNNVKDWLKTGVNSVDSISYYTDAQNKLAWIPHSYQQAASNLKFKELALHNAKVANFELIY